MATANQDAVKKHTANQLAAIRDTVPTKEPGRSMGRAGLVRQWGPDGSQCAILRRAVLQGVIGSSGSTPNGRSTDETTLIELCWRCDDVSSNSHIHLIGTSESKKGPVPWETAALAGAGRHCCRWVAFADWTGGRTLRPTVICDLPITTSLGAVAGDYGIRGAISQTDSLNA